jgi:hypothetical protein
MNGKYIKGFEQKTAKAFDDLILNYEYRAEITAYLAEHLSQEQRTHFANLEAFIEGFETELALELLATVDWVLQKNPAATVQDTLHTIHEWSERKQLNFPEDFVQIAYDHILEWRHHFA